MFLLDMSLDWMHVEAGEFISVKGEPCDSMFVVLNGRLRASEAQQIISEYSEEYVRGGGARALGSSPGGHKER